MKNKQIPKCLTKELLVEYLYGDDQTIRNAAIWKVIGDNLYSARPMLYIWNVDWAKLGIDMPSLSGIVWDCVKSCEAFESGLGIFSDILCRSPNRITYNYLCDFLKISTLDKRLRESIIDVIKRRTTVNMHNLIAQLFLKRIDAPDLDAVILHILENTNDVQKLCKKFTFRDMMCNRTWEGDKLPKICNIIVPYMDMLSLLRIVELCDYNHCVSDVSAKVLSRVMLLLETNQDNSEFYRRALDIAKLLPIKQGKQIFRALIRKKVEGSVYHYVLYVCDDTELFMKQELKFVVPMIAEGFDDTYATIQVLFTIYWDRLEDMSKIISTMSECQSFVEMVAKNSSCTMPFISLVYSVIERCEKKKGLASSMPSANWVDDRIKELQRLISLCEELIIKIAKTMENNGAYCANLLLLYPLYQEKMLNLWNIRDTNFQNKFLEYLSGINTIAALRLEKIFCEKVNRPLSKERQEKLENAEYQQAIVALLAV